ncbi:MAG: cytochrome P450 family protein [Dermatophilaceae bacterium]
MSLSPPSVGRIDVTDPAFRADPFPTYARLRAESPVHVIKVRPFGKARLVTRYDDVAAAFRDERLVKNARSAGVGGLVGGALPGPLGALNSNMLSLDGADHDRLRALVHKVFTPRRIETMRGEAEQLSHELLAAAAAKAERTGSFDLVADYALPFPLTLIGRILGVPERDNDRFHTWTVALLSASSVRSFVTSVPSVLAFLRYLRRLVAERTQDPRDDLISALATASADDDRLSPDEVLAMIILLLTAGHETTVNLIGTGTLALLQNPGELARMRDDPTVVGTGIEELLRYVVPAETATPRWAGEDLEIAGTVIPRGSMVLLGIASANRDSTQFADPDRLDLTRDPNRHVAFGLGMHYCLGASLSRLEGSIAIPALLQAMPGLHLTVPAERLRWRTDLVLRGVLSLPVAPA